MRQTARRGFAAPNCSAKLLTSLTARSRNFGSEMARQIGDGMTSPVSSLANSGSARQYEVKVDPLPTSLSTWISPLCASTIFLTILKPIPLLSGLVGSRSPPVGQYILVILLNDGCQRIEAFHIFRYDIESRCGTAGIFQVRLWHL